MNAGGLGNECAMKINGKCFSAPKIAEGLTLAECNEIKSQIGISNCGTSEPNYLAGAAKECGNINKLPTNADLVALF